MNFMIDVMNFHNDKTFMIDIMNFHNRHELQDIYEFS